DCPSEVALVPLLVAAGAAKARDGEGPGDALDGRPGQVDVGVGRRVAHVDVADGPGEGVAHGHVVDHAAVDEQPPVVLDGGVKPGKGAAREERRLQQTAGEHG